MFGGTKAAIEDESDADDWPNRRPSNHVRNKITKIAQSPFNKTAASIQPIPVTPGRKCWSEEEGGPNIVDDHMRV